MSGFFFFKQKTAYEMRISDWSSDVCSSDLAGADLGGDRLHPFAREDERAAARPVDPAVRARRRQVERSGRYPPGQEILDGLGILARAGRDGREERHLVGLIPAHVNIADPSAHDEIGRAHV